MDTRVWDALVSTVNKAHTAGLASAALCMTPRHLDDEAPRQRRDADERIYQDMSDVVLKAPETPARRKPRPPRRPGPVVLARHIRAEHPTATCCRPAVRQKTAVPANRRPEVWR